jgi:hypothetical protein
LIAAGLLLLGGVLLAPLSLPILSMKATERYIRGITFGAADKVYELTGDLHGMFGWRERVAAIAGVWDGLPPGERERTAIFAGWYGLAAAVDYFGPAYGLPGAFSGHMSYHLWGPPARAVDTWLVIGVSERDLASYFEEMIPGAEVELEDVNPWERRFVVLVCRRSQVDLREAWPRLRHWSF